jgi:hypothetical protein
MNTPACNPEAGSAMVLFAAMGNIRVTTTPIPNTAISTTIKSGLRFTFHHSLTLCTGWGPFCEALALIITRGKQPLTCGIISQSGEMSTNNLRKLAFSAFIGA